MKAQPNVEDTSTNEKKVTLTDKIYHEIKEDINSQQFSPGEKLSIKKLARKYGVSDTPVKQALQKLEDEKMVVSTPNKGMRVKTLTTHELNDIFDVRLMMDTFFVKDIISTLNYNDALKEQMLENLRLQREFLEHEATSEHQPEVYFELDMEFHTLYLTASGNQKVVEVLKYLQPFTYAAGIYLNQSNFRDKECVEEHEAIYDAIVASDTDALLAAVSTHIENSRRALQLIFKVNQMV